MPPPPLDAPLRGRLAAVPADEFDASRYGTPAGVSPRLRAVHPVELLAQRLPRYPSKQDRWFVFHHDGVDAPPFAAALVRGPDADGVATLVTLHHPAQHSSGSLARLLLPALRDMKCTRLQTAALFGSRNAWELQRAGFLAREWNPMIALPLNPRGEAAVRSTRNWQLSALDYDG
jgi:hypothetical protein